MKRYIITLQVLLILNIVVFMQAMQRRYSESDYLFTSLINAAKKGDDSTVKSLVAKHIIDVNGRTRDELKDTPLGEAIFARSNPVVLTLIRAGAKIEKKVCSVTPLYLAVELGQLDIVKTLVGEWANVNWRNERNESMVYIALKKEYPEIALFLLQSGARERGDEALHCAIAREYIDLIQPLINAGSEVNKGSGSSCLFYAMQTKKLPIVQILIKAGANVNWSDQPYHPSLLVTATRSGDLPIAQALIDAGANVNPEFQSYYDSPLHEACNLGHIDVIKALLKAGALVNARDRQGVTPLHVAAEKKCLPAVKVLIDQGAELNATDDAHCTPLDLTGTQEIIDFLLSKGATHGPGKGFCFICGRFSRCHCYEDRCRGSGPEQTSEYYDYASSSQ